MTFLVIAEIVVFAMMWGAVFWVTQPSRGNPFFDWRILGILAAAFSQLLMLAVVTALWDFKRSNRWLLIIVILLADAALLPPLMLLILPGPPLSQMGAANLLVGYATVLVVILTIGVVSILFLHTLLWPFQNMLGWRAHWSGETLPPIKPQFSIWQMLAWTTLIGALLLLGRTLAAIDSWMGMTTFLLLWGVSALLVGLPALVVGTRRRRLLFWLPALAFSVVVLSWAESELTFVLTKMNGAGTWLPMWLTLQSNGAIAAAVLLHVLLLRWLGIVFDLRLPFDAREINQTRNSDTSVAVHPSPAP